MKIFDHAVDMAKNLELDFGFFTVVLIVLELVSMIISTVSANVNFDTS